MAMKSPLDTPSKLIVNEFSPRNSFGSNCSTRAKILDRDREEMVNTTRSLEERV